MSMRGILVASLVVALHAQDAQRPSFRARVELVTADVSVVDADGRPVRDLKPEDFLVRVDGQPRTIVSAQFVDLAPVERAEPGPEPLYSTNEGAAAGRLIVFVVDQANIRTGGGRAVLRAAGRLLDRLTPADRVGLFTVPGSGPRLPFTNDFDRVRQALARVTGQASPVDTGAFVLSVAEAIVIADGDRRVLQEVIARECLNIAGCDTEIEQSALTIADDARERTVASIAAIKAVLEALAEVDGPKTVILVSEGLVVGRSSSSLTELGELAAAARVSVYVLRLSGSAFGADRVGFRTSAGIDSMIEAEGLETLAGLTRGTVFNVVGTGDQIFERVAREISGYYLLAFEPGPDDRDARAHQIRVEVRRSGVSVRARREFKAAPEAVESSTDQQALGRALGAPTARTDLPIRLSTYAFQGEPPSKVRLVVSAEIGGDHIGAADIGVAFALLDSRGRVVESGLQRTTLMPAVAGAPGPLRYQGALSADPGDYTLKVAAIDAEGRIGTVERAVQARLPGAGALRAGDLVVAERARGGAILQPPAVPRLRSRSALTYLELYGEREADLDAASVTVEIAGAAAADAPALVQIAAPFTSARDPGRRVATAEIELGLLPPGRYVARARITGGGDTAGLVTRAFEIDAPAGASAASTPTASSAAASAEAAENPAASPTAVRIDATSMVEPFRRDTLFEPPLVSYFLDELIGALPEPPPAPLAGAIESARSGRLADAASKIGEPRLHPVATFLRGLAALESNQREAAAGLFRSVLQSARGSYAAIVYLAACYAEGGRDDEAAGAWQTSLLGIEDAPIVYALLADAEMRMANGRRALETLREALAVWPDDERFTRRLGVALLLAGRPAEGMAAIDRHLAAHSDDEATLFRAIQAVYQVAAAAGAIESREADLARARRYAEAYARAKGSQQALVRTWMAFLEKK